ncbi:MAG: hypothetical protein ACFB0B_02355 [Thermonemataceae bacterium]
MNKIKAKYNALAQCKPESLSLSIALLAIYYPLRHNAPHRNTPNIRVSAIWHITPLASTLLFDSFRGRDRFLTDNHSGRVVRHTAPTTPSVVPHKINDQ